MADLEQQFPNVTALELNVCDRKHVSETITKIAEKYGTIDVLVNNADRKSVV